MTTVTKLDQNIEKAEEYLNKLLGTPYSWWTGGTVPDGAPAWAKNGEPPQHANVRGTSCFCAGVANLARRVVGLEIPTLGNPNYDGGVVAYFGSSATAPADFPRQGYFERHSKQRRFDLEEARRPWTLIGRKYRNVRDQGHVAIVIPGGKVLQSYDAGGGRPGVNDDATLERSHDGGYYEVMIRAEDWLLPFGAKPDEHVPQQPREPEQEVLLFTNRQLIEMAENAGLEPATVEKYRDALIPEMREAGVTTPLRMAAFFGNVMVETAQLNTLEEYGDRNYWMYLDRNSGKAGEWRYHGRGFLMNTWSSAYANLSRVLDVDLVSNPDLLEQPRFAAKAAMWFWRQHDLNAHADRGNFKAVSSIINTGRADRTPNHWEQRLHFYDVAKRVLASRPDATDDELDRNGFNRDGLPYINLAAVGQADETAAFALAAEIRRAGIGVTVTNGRANVYALAKKLRSEPLGYRQLWIIGDPALEACGDFAELANWPISPKTDYYNLAGKDFTGTCRRAAELADEKAKQGVGRRFLEGIGPANAARPKLPLPKPVPPQDEAGEQEEDGRKGEEEERRRRRREERAKESEEDRDYLETPIDEQDEEQEEEEYRHRRREEDGRRDGNDYEPNVPETVEGFTDEELEEIGREIVSLFSRIRQNRTPRRESEAHVGKEDH